MTSSYVEFENSPLSFNNQITIDIPLSKEIAQRRFQQALTVIRQLPYNLQPTSQEKLRLYGFYKQAVYGHCSKRHFNFTNDWEAAKWIAWNEVSHLSNAEAQEQYFTTVLQYLHKYEYRQDIQMLIESLERGRRIGEIQSNQPQTPPDQHLESDSARLSLTSPCDSDLDSHKSVPLFAYDDRLCILTSPPFPSSYMSIELDDYCADKEEDFYDEDGSQLSDDCASLSTITMKTYRRCSTTSIARHSPSSKITKEVELALESLQTKVTALNERIDKLQLEIKNNSQLDLYNWCRSLFKCLKNFINFSLSTFTGWVFLLYIFRYCYGYRGHPFIINRWSLLLPILTLLKWILTKSKKTVT